jgi:hypothetical protein
MSTSHSSRRYHSPIICLLLFAFFVNAEQECKLSNKAEAAVTLYTTVFATFVSTISGNFLESFIMAWISYLPFVRGTFGVGIYTYDAVYHIIHLPSLGRGEDTTHDQYRRRATLLPKMGTTSFSQEPASYIVWWLWHTYLPYSQWDWFVTHHKTADAGLLFVRGVAVGMLLVAMSIDYKTRVIRAIGVMGTFGRRAAYGMCILSLAARLSLLGLMSTEFILAAIKNPNTTDKKNSTFIPVYIIFSIIWGSISFLTLKGRDGVDRFGEPLTRTSILFKLFAAPFYCIFTCSLAFAVYLSANASNGLTLSAFVKCESMSVWNKIRNILF